MPDENHLLHVWKIYAMFLCALIGWEGGGVERMTFAGLQSLVLHGKVVVRCFVRDLAVIAILLLVKYRCSPHVSLVRIWTCPVPERCLQQISLTGVEVRHLHWSLFFLKTERWPKIWIFIPSLHLNWGAAFWCPADSEILLPLPSPYHIYLYASPKNW